MLRPRRDFVNRGKPWAASIDPRKEAIPILDSELFAKANVRFQPVRPDPVGEMVGRNCAIERESRGLRVSLEVGEAGFELGKEVTGCCDVEHAADPLSCVVTVDYLSK